jgi:hypothetical protein
MRMLRLPCRAFISVRPWADDTLLLPRNAASPSGTPPSALPGDRRAPLASEGIPYALPSFTQLGIVANEDALLERGEGWKPASGEKGATYRDDFPVAGAVLMLP